MAAVLIGGSALGAAFELLFKAVLDAIQKVGRYNSDLRRLKSTLDSIKLANDDIQRFDTILDTPLGETERFADQLNKGVILVQKCSNVKRNVFKRLYYSNKISKLESELLRFFQIEMPVYSMRETKKISVGVNQIAAQLERSVIGGANSGQFVGWCSAPAAPDFVVGVEQSLEELREMLLEDGENVVVLSAPGGCGKTTLAKMICHDEKIKGVFGENIFFVTVSRSPCLSVIVQKIFQTVTDNQRVANFQSDEDAINQLEQLFQRHIRQNPVLLVLDDVWSSSSGEESLIEKFMLNRPCFKVLVTSRCVFPRFNTYRLKPLSYHQAVELFRHFAFENGIYSVSSDLVDKAIKCCGGFPLALKVVGRSLYRQREVTWRSRISKWSNGESIFTSSNDLLCCLKLSLEALDERMRECYLDLGSFSEDQKIPVAALLDMWVELYNLDEENALACLYELFNRNLVDLTRDRTEADDDIEYCNEQFAMQHDLLRELAIYHNGQEPIEYRRRVILDVKNNDLPKWWTERNQEPINARIMSTSTDWYDIKEPKIEVLILNFRARFYILPPFIWGMRNLKVLSLTNNGSCPAKVHNFPAPDHLPNLKRIRLEHISISSISSGFLHLRNLRKLSLIMCEIGNALENCDVWPNLVEINIEYSDDLVELPFWFFKLNNLKKLVIGHCPELIKLPEELGNLSNLEVLRLHSCTTLQELPESIGRLHKLRFLDLSDCVGIECLPEQMGQLSSLRKLDMRGCRGLSELPSSLLNFVPLELRVMCDEETAYLWGYHDESLDDDDRHRLEEPYPQEEEHPPERGVLVTGDHGLLVSAMEKRRGGKLK
ncbi:hypothetical protein DH2020_037315 [Rehmannia glutinosa]|uniref:RPW8 domain-containing protein n=1 Tax=Rehmannia glutinosa TaxID=99300 RepID=A0ABR0V3Q9_REHGL